MASVAALSLLLSVSLAASLGVARGAWTDTGSLVNVRTGHTATALLDGRVLVAGGFGGPPTGARACLNSAEVYDPVSARWNATAPMNFARCFHAATLLDDGTGRVIVTGGTGANGSALASIEFFDPATLTWASAPRDDMRTPRAYHQSALLSRGDILVIGGYNGQSGYLASVEQYRVDLPTSPWNPVGALSVGRANFTATRLPNDRILVAGGRIAPDTDTNTAEFCSNLVYCTWLATANAMDVARSAHTATLLANNDVLIAGGFSGGSNPTAGAEVYDNSRFGNTLTEMVAARALHQTVLLFDGSALAVGGVGAGGEYLDSIESYTDGSRRWTRGELGSALGTARASFTATRLFNGNVLAAGGTNDRVAATASCEIYN